MTDRAPNINRSRNHEDMVQRLAMLKLPGAERTLFPTIRELLCFAALLGYSEGRRLALDPAAGVEDISYQQFERGDAEDLIYLIALAETKDPEILREGEESQCARIFEEYANGGLQLLHDTMLQSGGEYPDRDILQFLLKSEYLNVDDAEPDVSGISF